MKSIYVSVKEFLENGGEFNQDRTLFDDRYQTTGWFDKNVQVANPFVIIVSRHFSTHQMPLESVFVQIEVTPIYK